MELALLLKSILALLFVLGLMFVSLWLLKSFNNGLAKNKFIKGFSSKNRIKIIESKKIDVKNTIILLEADGEEFLLALSSGGATVLKQKKAKKEKNDDIKE